MTNQNRKAKATSVQSHLSLLMFAIIIFTVCFVAIINWLFLDKYYFYKARQHYENAYIVLQECTDNNNSTQAILTNSLSDNVKSLSTKFNASVIVRLVYNDNVYFINAGSEDVTNMIFKLSDRSNGNFGNGIVDSVKKIGNATIRIISEKNGDLDSNSIEMWGRLNDNVSFFMISKFDDIKNAATTSTQFIILIGFLSALISMFVAFILARRFSKPIQKLNVCTKEIANMNFSRTYTDNSYKEINELGESINYMSNCIQEAINKLRQTNLQLKQDIKDHENIDKMRNEFISNVSHELKTPLALIMGYAEGLKIGINDSNNEDKEFYCDVIIDETERMNSMVKNLLLLNELEFGKVEYNIESFNIVELINNIINSYHILIKQKGIDVIFKQEETITVYTDASKIETVIRNFITNAINHIDDKKIIKIDLQIKENGRLRISVFNTGKHIPEDCKDMIWDKFYKVDKARTREYGGNGIGLSIVKAILDSIKKPYGCMNKDGGVEFFFELDTDKSLKKYL